MKLLADSSVWIDHLHAANEYFARALEAKHIHVHQDVIGELACGTLANRVEVLTRLMRLPELPAAWAYSAFRNTSPFRCVRSLFG